MSLTRIASRYAKSLIDFAQAQGKLDRIYEDILNLKVAADIREFNLLCKSPIITSGKKSEVYRALFEKIFDPITFGFFNILVRKGREEYMPEIAHEFLKQYDAINKN
ncbi:MAG: F0F1 ATP synthase subunit delta [Saprospiraceae bacterium]|nr:F0F1 ATP synthase subunit delta [Saprospiraceae bacterium]